MIKRSFAYAVMALVVLNFSPLWALTGTLINNSNNPLANATVQLVNKNLLDTTDANGYFSFSEASVKKTNTSIGFTKPVLSGNSIHFTLSKSGPVEYAIYSVKGSMIFHSRSTMNQGNHLISITKCNNNLSNGVYIIKFKTDDVTTSFNYYYFDKNRFSGALPSNNVQNGSITTVYGKHSADTVVDTLIIKKVESTVTSMRKIRIYNYTDNINSTKYTSNGMQIVIIDPSNDNDGDGLTNFEERYLYSTNAEIADCDGDGVNDYTEIKDNTNSLIANIPDISFAMNNYPVITATYSQSVGSSNSREISSGGEYSNTSTYSSQQQVNASISVALMVGGEISFGKDAGGKISGSLTTTVGAGFTQTWTSEQSTTMTKNWNDAQTTATSNDVTITGGTINVDVTFTNNSGQDFTIVDPKIRLTGNGSTLSTAIGELSVSGNTDIYISSATGSNTTMRTFTTTISNPDLVKEIATQSSGLTAQLTNINFRTSLGEIDTLMTNVYNRTAQVIVDFGTASSNRLIKKRVASHCKYNDFYTSQLDRYVPLTLKEALVMAGVTPTCGTDANGNYGITAIDSLKNGALAKGVWSVVCQMDDSLEMFSTSMGSYYPETTTVGQADIITCSYDFDQDSDGVSDRLESVLGTDPLKVDSDSDGISDKDELMGWRRTTDAVGDTWETNPRLKDTDGDSLDDYVDPYPLIAAISPADSFVTFSKIALTSLQGNTWTDTTFSDKISDTVNVNEVVRGPGAISVKFAHSVYSVKIVCKNSNDTTIIFSPDTNGIYASYSAKLNLVPGRNDVELTVVSKNGVTTKKILLQGIPRRLAMVTDTVNQFVISKPGTSLNWKASNITIDFDKIKAMDSKITEVYLLRTQTFSAPATQSAIDSISTPNNIGDSGDGTLNLSAGKTAPGFDNNKKDFTVIRILNSTTSTFTDSSLRRDSLYCYFIATSYELGTKHFFTMSPALKGIKVQPDQSFIIDSVTFNIYYNTVGINYDTKIQTKIIISNNGTQTWASPDTSHEQWGGTGTTNHVTIPVGVTIPSLDSYQKISYTNGNSDTSVAEFMQDYGTTWYDMFNIKSFYYGYEITHPKKYLSTAMPTATLINKATSLNAWEEGTYSSDVSKYGVNQYCSLYTYDIIILIQCWYTFNNTWTTYWHYANGDSTNSGY
jgi:hypothetical protein